MPKQRVEPRAPARGIGAGGEQKIEPARGHADIARETIIGLASAVGVVLLFSSFVLVSRYGLRSELQPADLAFLRFLVSGLVLLPVLVRHGTGGLPLRQVALLAALGGLAFALLAYHGFARAPASHGSALIHGTLPAFSLLAGYFIVGHRPERSRLLGGLAIGAGVLLMIWDSLLVASSRQLLGDMLLLSASACWAGYGVLVRRHGLSATTATAIVTTSAMIGYVPAYLGVTSLRILNLPLSDVLFQAAFQGLLIGALSGVLYTRVVETLGANAAALSAALVPALTTIMAIPLLGEEPSVSTLLGVVLLTCGIIGPWLVRQRTS